MRQFQRVVFLIIAMVLLIMSGCNNKTSVSEIDSTSWAEQIKIAKVEFTPAKRLEVITWHDYVPQEVLDLFTKTYGTQIVPTLISSNEEMFDLLRKNPSKYDLVMPSDYMVIKMLKAGLLRRLEHGNIPNMDLLDEDVRRLSYDRGLLYTVPLSRDCIGIAFNIKYVAGIPRNWGFIIEQLRNDYLAYRGGIRKEMRVALGLALMLRGYSPNTIDPGQIGEARDLLIDTIKRHGLKLTGPQGGRQLINNKILLGLVWNGTGAYALANNPDVRFLLPEGKALVNYDSIAISVESQRARTAELFIDYMLIPQVSARMSNYNYFAGCNSAALPYVEKIIRNGPGFMFPDEEDRLFLKDLGANIKLYEDAWNLVLQTKTPDSLVELPLPKDGIFKGDTRGANFTKKFIEEMEKPKNDSP